MNALDVLMYGHQTLIASIEGLPDADWESPGVAGAASVKDLFAHMASMELVLAEVLRGFLRGGPTPYLDEMREQGDGFNDRQIANRKDTPAREVLAEYNDAHGQVMVLAVRLPAEIFRQAGTLPWYGAQYDLDDFIAYTYYGHKREHSAQIGVFRDRLGR